MAELMKFNRSPQLSSYALTVSSVTDTFNLPMSKEKIKAVYEEGILLTKDLNYTIKNSSDDTSIMKLEGYKPKLNETIVVVYEGILQYN